MGKIGRRGRAKVIGERERDGSELICVSVSVSVSVSMSKPAVNVEIRLLAAVILFTILLECIDMATNSFWVMFTRAKIFRASSRI